MELNFKFYLIDMKNKFSRAFLIVLTFSLVYYLDNQKEERFSSTPKNKMASRVIQKKPTPEVRPQKEQPLEQNTTGISFPNREEKKIQEEITPPEPQNTLTPETVSSSPQLVQNQEQETDSYDQDPYYEDTRDTYQREDSRETEVQEEPEDQSDLVYQDDSIVLCQAYAPYCEPKEIYEQRQNTEIEYCLTTYINCVDENKENISAPMTREAAESYIEKKLKAFYKDNY